LGVIGHMDLDRPLDIKGTDAEPTSALRCRRTVSVCTFLKARKAGTLRLLCTYLNDYIVSALSAFAELQVRLIGKAKLFSENPRRKTRF